MTPLASLLVPAAAAALLALVACGGGGSSAGGPPPVGTPSVLPSTTPKPTPSPSASPSTGPSPTAAPSATPVGSGVGLSPTSLAFDAAGAGAPTQSVSAAQINNTTGFTLTTSTCNGIVSVAPASGAGPFVFTPLIAGTCSYIVTGIGGYSATLPITVTTTTLPQQ